MIELKCEQVYQALDNIEAKQAPGLSVDELNELKTRGYVAVLPSAGTIDNFNADLVNFRQQYNTTSSELTQMYQQLIKTLDDRQKAGLLGQAFGAHRSQLKTIQTQIKMKQEELNFIKANLLRTTAQRDALDRTVELFDEHIYRTTVGDNIANEIRVRPRMYDRPLSTLIPQLQQLDQKMTEIMAQIQSYIQGRNFAPIWIPYLLNLNLIHFIPRLDSIAEQREDYDKAEQEMFQLIINHFNQAQRDQYPSMTTYEKIYYQIAQVLGADRCNSERVRMVLVQIAQLLYSWNPIIAYHDTSVTNLTPQTVVPPPQSNEELINIYLRHLQDLINEITRPNTVATKYCDGIKFGSFSSTESIMAVLLLAFAEDPLKYNYFYPKMTEGVEGTQFFAAVLSLLPWAAEETWQIVLRAESSVLRGQGVQFIPELLEYAILLVMNPQIMAMINGISIEFFARWRFVVIPSVLAVATSSLEKEIENYVQRRPLAYITNPQPYYYSYGYFYRPFYPYYYRPWYARPYHYTSYYSTSHRPGYVSHGPGYSGSSYHGSRYSSLHHHTIG